MILSVSLLIAVAALQPAPADWRALGQAESMQLSWDAGGVTRSGDITTIRIRTVPQPPRQGENAYAISRVELRCATGEARVADTTNYASDGTEGLRDATNLSFSPIPPESFFATVSTEVCAPPAPAR
ncbi:MAG TPA: hypothetical protein VMG08_21825 [Allosphingosinicella sp.]|nr:hypothetical protein [Allosphingosinicella sp.]